MMFRDVPFILVITTAGILLFQRCPEHRRQWRQWPFPSQRREGSRWHFPSCWYLVHWQFAHRSIVSMTTYQPLPCWGLTMLSATIEENSADLSTFQALPSPSHVSAFAKQDVCEVPNLQIKRISSHLVDLETKSGKIENPGTSLHQFLSNLWCNAAYDI